MCLSESVAPPCEREWTQSEMDRLDDRPTEPPRLCLGRTDDDVACMTPLRKSNHGNLCALCARRALRAKIRQAELLALQEEPVVDLNVREEDAPLEPEVFVSRMDRRRLLHKFPETCSRGCGKPPHPGRCMGIAVKR